MNKYFVFAFICLVFEKSIAQQSDSTAMPVNVNTDNKLNLIIKADVLLPLLYVSLLETGYGSLTIEKGFKRRHSVQLTGVYAQWTRHYEFQKDFKRNGTQIIPEYKFFISKRKHYTGFYTGIYVKYSYLKSEYKWQDTYYPSYNNTEQSTYNNIASGFITGYQNYILKRRFVIDVLIGAGYSYDYGKRFVDTYNETYTTTNDQYMWDIRLAVNLGYRF